MLIYLYDNTNSPVGMMYRTNAYAADTYDYFLFEKNLQGDIVAVYNSSGTKLLSYTYDAWGNCTVTGSTTTGAQYNPFRYRGYYYDSELGLYYLNSRYYDSQIGRFINLDALINGNSDLIGFNLFAYCSNNPVIYVDEFGYAITYDLNEPDWWSSFIDGWTSESSVKVGYGLFNFAVVGFRVKRWHNSYKHNFKPGYELNRPEDVLVPFGLYFLTH